MIQIRRGSTESWKNLKTPLAAGQPGYDKNKHKIKIGDGTNLWADLPYASLTEEEVLDSESNARERISEDTESLAIITYGTAGPDDQTVGKLYLQRYDTEPEADYVVNCGVNSGWHYRKWRSGLAECWCVKSITTSINTAATSTGTTGTVYYSDTPVTAVAYPVTFLSSDTSAVVETATLQGRTAGVWLATDSENSLTKSASYRLACYTNVKSDTYKIAISVKGYYK